MKKIFMSIIAFAAMAMTMTSCNKDEAINAADFDATFEDTEVMNQVKTHFVNDDQYWDNGDQIYVLDGNRNGAYYVASTTDGVNMHLVFNQVEYGNFNVNNGELTAFFPYTLLYNRLPNEVLLPHTQHTAAGELTNFPLYGKGTISEFQWYNLCAIMTFYVTGDVALDSVTITTDKYLNGHFKVNLNNDNMLSYQSGNYGVLAHGTRTNTLRFANPLQLNSTAQEVNIYLPAGTFKSFNITFYSNGTKCVKRNRVDMTIQREHYNYMSLALNSTDFVPFTKGTIDARYNVAAANETPQYVVFSQGNLEYVSAPRQYWYFADNQWDFRSKYQSKDGNNQYDRDLFAWGANGYYYLGNLRSGYGNNIYVWGTGSDYNYYNGTSGLSGTNEWGYNMIANAGNTRNSGWRTLTATEMQNLLDNYPHAMVTLSFVGKKGMIIFPTDVTPVPDNSSLSKSEWNALEAEGCVFFVADFYRAATGTTLQSRMTNTGSYFWLNTPNNASEASALWVGKTGDPEVMDNISKKTGAFVRLVKDAE